ncbi:hypothetical protein [Planctomonas psychrotolerans]|uniref:hypothetical protein n=1 Tax=Planctomonas psychrotolerans TaxID=2528712 RepID=UPI00123A6397|nr:hypothetical protein [Planctomonas psychrotolerans]
MNVITHPTKKKTTWMTRAAVLGATPVLALGLAGCSTAGDEEGASVEDVQEMGEEAEEDLNDGEAVTPYEGAYDQTFYDDVEDVHAGQFVTVTALVNQVVTPEAFTIAGGDNTTVDELLVLHEGTVEGLEPELDVSVSGTAEVAFVLVDVEESMGIDLDDDAFAEWEGLPYIDATTVDSTVNLEE